MEQHTTRAKKSCGHTLLEFPDLSSRELAFKLTDEQQIFMSDSSIYRILKKRLITLLHIFLSTDEF
ncbi:MAG: helix-turn-helix domain-containing protein [Saprospiraceae bacterium]|nr:helix-turn-helix domain-containing protein [Candidatus Vicinibacter affinis]